MHTTKRNLKTALTVLSSLALVGIGTAVNAQPYAGQAYILRGNVGVNVGPGATPLVNVAAGAEINRVDLPNPNGGAGNSANGAQNGLSANIPPAVALNVIQTSTVEITSAVTSNALITGANVLPNFSTFLPNSVNLPGINMNVTLLGAVTSNVTLGFGSITGSLAQASVLGATAFDAPGVFANGTSNIEGLTALSSVLNVQTDGANNPLPNQTFYITVPINLTTTVNGSISAFPLPDINVTNLTLTGTANAVIGEIIVNEQLPGGNPDLITVNALHIKLYPVVDLPDVELTGSANIAGLGLTNFSTTAVLPTTDILGEDLATTDLILSSATAGAAAPEPGTLALAGIGILGFAGIARRKRAILRS